MFVEVFVAAGVVTTNATSTFVGCPEHRSLSPLTPTTRRICNGHQPHQHAHHRILTKVTIASMRSLDDTTASHLFIQLSPPSSIATSPWLFPPPPLRHGTSMFNSTCTSTNTSTTTSNDVLLPSQLIRLLSLPRPVTRPAVVRPCTVPPPLVYAHLCCLRDRLLAQQERHRRLRHEDIDTAPTLELPNATTTSASTTSTSTSTSTSSLKTVSLDGDDAWEGLLLPYATKLHPIQRCVHLPDINADARRFNSARHLDLTVFLQALFHDVAEAIGCTLSICDLQHTHMFLTAHSDDGFEERGELGLLFHAREYPAWDDQTFPFYLGFCQNGSNLYLNRDDATAMRLRSAVWLLGCNVVVVLDADGAERWPFGTVYESELGKPVADIFFFDGGKTQWPLHRINQGLHVVRYA